MAEILSIRQCVQRLREEGFPIAEHTIRRWISENQIPVCRTGNKVLVYYKLLYNYITHADYRKKVE